MFANLFYVSIPHLEKGSCEIRKDSKGFSLRRGGVASQAAFGILGNCLLGKIKRGFGH